MEHCSAGSFYIIVLFFIGGRAKGLTGREGGRWCFSYRRDLSRAREYEVRDLIPI